MSSSGTSGPGSPAYERQQHSYTFSGRVLLTAVVILAILTIVFVLIRLLLFQFVLRGSGRGRGGLAVGVRRSFGRLSSRRQGLDAAALAALPVTAYHRNKEGQDAGAGGSTSGGAATDCAVCLSELADGEKVRALPSCGHVFHVECVDAWLKSRTTCPVCRADVAPTKDAAPPAVFGAGGTLVVTVVESGVAQTRGSLTPALGTSQPVAGAAR